MSDDVLAGQVPPAGADSDEAADRDLDARYTSVDVGEMLCAEDISAPLVPEGLLAELPLRLRHWEDFERLIVALAADVDGLAEVRRHGTSGQAQHGIDVVGFTRSPRQAHAYQGKNVTEFSKKDLAEAVTTFINGRRPYGARRLVLAVTVPVNSTQSLEWLDSAIRENPDLAIELWDAPRINELLRTRPEIVTIFFGEQAARRFCLPVVSGTPGQDRFSTISVEPPVGRLPLQLRGRDELLEALWSAVQSPDGRVHLLAGMGGIGKTAVALALADRAQREGHRTWWVRGDSLGLPADLLEVARQLGAKRFELDEASSGRRSAASLAWQFLRAAEPGWVLVVDGADDPESLAAEGRSFSDGGGWIRPADGGLVLVTSRQGDGQTWGRDTLIHPALRPLEAGDGASVLVDLAPQAGTAQEARDLAARLGGMPLALHLAGLYLAWPLARYRTFPDYRQALDAEFAGTVDAAALIRPARPDPRDLVMKTWELSLDALDARGVPQGRAMLRRLSYYAPAIPIPRRLLAAGAEIDSKSAAAAHGDARVILEQGLNGLLSLGLIDVQPLLTVDGPLPGPGIVIHALVAETSREHQAAAHRPGSDSLSGPLYEAVLQMTEAGKSLPEDDPEYRLHWQVLAPHIGALLAHLPSASVGLATLVLVLASKAAMALMLGGVLADAEHLAASGLEHARRFDSGESALPGTFAYIRAWVLVQQGRLEEGEAQAHQAMDMLRQDCGSEPDEVLQTRALLASVHRLRGRLTEAESESAEVLQAMRSRYGPDDPRTLGPHTELALTLDDQGRLAEAETEMRSILDATRRIHGDEHFQTLNALHNLALVLSRRGCLEEAAQLFRTALEGRWQILGRHHHATLSTWHQHTQTWWLLDAADEAVTEMARVAQQAQLVVLGDGHLVTFHARQDLATMLLAKERLIEAGTQARLAVASSRLVYGDDHPKTLLARGFLVTITFKARPNKALTELRAILSVSQRVLGENDPFTLTTRMFIAQVLEYQGEFRPAEKELATAVAFQLDKLGKHHPDVLHTRLFRASLLVKLGELDAAKDEARILLRDAGPALGPDHDLVQLARQLLTGLDPGGVTHRRPWPGSGGSLAGPRR